MALIEKYFGTITRQPQPKRPDLTEPPHTAERRSTIEDPLARLPQVDIAFVTPPTGSPDFDALDVVSWVLSTGRSSRLNQVVVREKQLAVTAGAVNPDKRGPGLFQVSAQVAPGKTPADVEAALLEEIEKVKNGPIHDWEIEKAHNNAHPPAGRRVDQHAAARDPARRVRALLRQSRTWSTRARRTTRRSPPPTCSASRRST